MIRGLGGQDALIGGGGADIMYGGPDSDAYYVDNAGDIVWEYAGEGTGDYVIASTSYALTAGSEIEQLQVDDYSSTAPSTSPATSLTTSSSAAMETTSSMAAAVPTT